MYPALLAPTKQSLERLLVKVALLVLFAQVEVLSHNCAHQVLITTYKVRK